MLPQASGGGGGGPTKEAKGFLLSLPDKGDCRKEKRRQVLFICEVHSLGTHVVLCLVTLILLIPGTMSELLWEM